MHPKNLSISDFTYDLPLERIAKYPLDERDMSKLLVLENEKMITSVYQNLAEFLPSDTLLIFNDTKVVKARLLFKKVSGAFIEIFCLEPHDQYADITSAMLQKGKVWWKCLIGGASKWKRGTKLQKVAGEKENPFVLEAAIVERLSDCFVVELCWQPEDLTFAEMLQTEGDIPLPPYLQRDAEEVDKERYQTIYAKHNGSVAAPTAGLHFTDITFNKLEAKNIKRDFVTLHVGAGTFRPVKSQTMQEHEMHTEFIEVSQNVIQNLINHSEKTIVAVGTTSLRTIESLYWMGIKIINEPTISSADIYINQWDPYETEPKGMSTLTALTALSEWMTMNQMTRLIAKTQILIAPGYKLKVAKGIITNFHQPQSTLLLLVAAIAGSNWRKVYQYALENDFRFLSYGDGCLLWSNE